MNVIHTEQTVNVRNHMVKKHTYRKQEQLPKMKEEQTQLHNSASLLEDTTNVQHKYKRNTKQ